MPKFSLDDYVDVAERVAMFTEKYPEGSLQSSWSKVEIDGRHFIVCEAQAYRTPDDPRPGVGLAWEPFPGPTPYTKDSELMNSQTSAWGRAIVACGLAANRKIASKQEVKARQAPAASPPKPTLPPESVDEAIAAIQASGQSAEWVRNQLISVGAKHVPDGQLKRSTIEQLTPAQAVELVAKCAGAREQA